MHSAKKASRSAGSSPTTWCGWPYSSKETTPNSPIQTMRARWMRGPGCRYVTGSFRPNVAWLTLPGRVRLIPARANRQPGCRLDGAFLR